MSGANPVGSVIECRTFGMFSVLVDGVTADLGGRKQRLLLALLVCRANSVVPVRDLIDTVWGGRPPRTAQKNVQVYISKLRRIFGDRLGHAGHGYRLRIGPAECDLLSFEQAARLGRQLLRDGDTAAAAGLIGQAVAVWHEPLAEFGDEPSLAAELGRWHELFLTALEDWAELAVESGDHQAALDQLAGHVRPNALRERLGAAWIRALAAAGRIQEALVHYEFVRRTLADELGVDPSPALAEVHSLLLNGSARAARPWGRTQQAPGNQLPRALPDFVGRTAEVDQVTGNLTVHTGHKVVVVSGPVGSGKSTFAVHVAHLVRDSYPDGQLLLDLANPDGGAKPAALVLEELLDMIGLGGSTQKLARWRSWIARRKLLLVLANAMHEDMVRALLPGSGASAVIAAARSRLSGLESVLRIRLTPLTEAESRELLGRIIGPGRILANRDAVRRILDYCEGSPLVVRIVGAKLAALRHITLAGYADRLHATERVLDELTAGESALRTRHDACYSSLSNLQRAAYHRLATLPPPPFEHDRLVAAMADLPASAEQALESLLECNLLVAPDSEVTAHGAYYDMPAFGYWHCREVSPEVIRRDAAGNP
ncbi:AfsR family transcriptional regulator [Kibdelosporangium aridum]|uniref:AfsR family transcriptional regulator n=1 Tax=Kibdelosporangium aridum TaxID=2030 RepID=A0A428Z0U8_KIBAR|nr:BTAD domain-containing putative transcriptional regulator [Kibdelosporangium aridum]RSM78153.1 AfsR family transcriptional regulator [Kibdelosporangium aridum]